MAIRPEDKVLASEVALASLIIEHELKTVDEVLDMFCKILLLKAAQLDDSNFDAFWKAVKTKAPKLYTRVEEYAERERGTHLLKREPE